MSFEWSTQQIAQTLKIPFSGTNQKITEIVTDSRKVKPGCLFLAIKGETHDGHEFIQTAIDQGAVAVIAEIPENAKACTYFQVPSTLDAIRALAHFYRKTFNIPVIGVVGAVGKTTTKELLSSLFSGKFQSVCKTEGSQNGFLGIPLTLIAMATDAKIAIIEIGIDEIGAMEKHLALVEPTHLILTKNGPEHLHQLKTEAIAAQEELKAFDYALTNQRPLAINLSDEYVNAWFKENQTQLKASDIKTYSLEKSKVPEYLGTYDNQANELTLRHEGLNATFLVPLPGEHHAHNLLAAVTLTQFFQLSVNDLKKGLANFKTAYGRTEIHSFPNDIEVIGDYYNSNPTSLRAALQLLAAKKGKADYHAVLGDMLELGTEEEKFHREIASCILELKITKVWLYGDRMKWLKSELGNRSYHSVQHFDSLETLTSTLGSSLRPHSQILIKGSRGTRMERVLKQLLEAKSS